MVVGERRQEFIDLVRNRGIRVALHPDRNNFYFCMVPATDGKPERIFVGLAVLERMWAYSYSFAAFYRLRHQRGYASVLTPENSPSVAPAWALIGNAHRSEIDRTRMAWSPEFPNPAWESHDEAVVIANSLFLNVTCFMLLHEVAHFHLNHLPANLVSDSDSIRDEFAADRWAFDFMLEHCDRDHIPAEAQVARANGISTGMALLANVELGIDPYTPRDHPKVPDRILEFFSRYLPESSTGTDTIWNYPRRFVACVLFAFMGNRGVDFPYHKAYRTTTDLLFEMRNYF